MYGNEIAVQENLALPADAVVPGVTYTPQNLPPVTNSYIAVHVSQIEDPGNFWLQLDERHDDLETLMGHIQ